MIDKLGEVTKKSLRQRYRILLILALINILLSQSQANDIATIAHIAESHE
ncbi:MAG: hypothetical protein ACI9VT_000475 [Psychroserpens sp.]|jgi:hypothetical protein